MRQRFALWATAWRLLVVGLVGALTFLCALAELSGRVPIFVSWARSWMTLPLAATVLAAFEDYGAAGVAAFFASIVIRIGYLWARRATGTWRSRHVGIDDQLNVVIQLAQIAWQQWSEEAAARFLNRPDPLALRWVATRRPVTVARSDKQAVDSVIAGFSGSGSVAEIADRLIGLPSRRLVILGSAGSGKSVAAMLLVLDLLKRRRSDHTLPVPLLVSISSWRPEEELWSWLVRRLGEDNPAITGLVGSQDQLKTLVFNHQVLPILDGLDEIPATWHSAAIRGIDLAMAGDVPFVLTSRADEFDQAVSKPEATGNGLVSIVDRDGKVSSELGKWELLRQPISQRERTPRR